MDMFYTCKKFKCTLNSGVSYHIKFSQIALFSLNMNIEIAKLHVIFPLTKV